MWNRINADVSAYTLLFFCSVLFDCDSIKVFADFCTWVCLVLCWLFWLLLRIDKNWYTCGNGYVGGAEWVLLEIRAQISEIIESWMKIDTKYCGLSVEIWRCWIINSLYFTFHPFNHTCSDIYHISTSSWIMPFASRCALQHHKYCLFELKTFLTQHKFYKGYRIQQKTILSLNRNAKHLHSFKMNIKCLKTSPSYERKRTRNQSKNFVILLSCWYKFCWICVERSILICCTHVHINVVII